MRGDGRRLKLLTSHTANFHVTGRFCFITPAITDAENVEIHYGGGGNGAKFSESK